MARGYGARPRPMPLAVPVPVVTRFPPPPNRLRGRMPTHGADPALIQERKREMILRRRAGWTMVAIGHAFQLTASACQRIVGPGIQPTHTLAAPLDLVGFLASARSQGVAAGVDSGQVGGGRGGGGDRRRSGGYPHDDPPCGGDDLGVLPGMVLCAFTSRRETMQDYGTGALADRHCSACWHRCWNPTVRLRHGQDDICPTCRAFHYPKEQLTLFGGAGQLVCGAAAPRPGRLRS